MDKISQKQNKTQSLVKRRGGRKGRKSPYKRGQQQLTSPPPVQQCLDIMDQNGSLEIGDDMFEIKVKWKADIMRLEVSADERLGQVADRFGERVGQPPGDLGFILDNNSDGSEQAWIPRDTKVSALNLNYLSFLTARCRDQLNPDAADMVELKVQTRDRRESVNIKIRLTDKMSVLMSKFAELKNLQLDNLRFSFDGEKVEGQETPEDLELDDGECIDVHQI